LAAGGIIEAPVLKKPVVAIIPTGNELVVAGQDVLPGKNVESNSHMLSAYLRKWGAQPITYPLLDDDPEIIFAVAANAIAVSDLVLILAGSSKGTTDYLVHFSHTSSPFVLLFPRRSHASCNIYMMRVSDILHHKFHDVMYSYM